MIASSLLLVAFSMQVGPDADLSVYIRAGDKTHGPGEHDHPRFLEDWTTLLEERGCEVEGSLAFPSAEELERADVLVMYAAEGGSIHGDERERLEAFLARGGGIVVLHDAVCGDDAHWFKTVVGGAWEHGHSKWHTGEIGLYFADREHPITRGVANFDFVDEIYHELHMTTDARVLANAFHTPFDVTPQMWVVERDYRAFVSIQGHYHDSFSHPAWRTLLLRGIAWAAGRDADSLVSAEEVAALRYPEGGPRRPEEARETFELHPDFELELVAAEPLVVNPISIDWDPSGRMWVALTPGYPDKEEFSGVAAHDLIAILEDADGDGRMDRRKVFHEGLDLVTSLVHHRDGVIVTAAPRILWLRDTDGDDVADVETVLYTGFGYSDTHAVISNMRWGLDGWIYATQGYSGNASDVTGFPATEGGAGGSSPGGWGLGKGKPFGRIGNGVLRFRPDGTAIEQVASYGSNTWGLDFTWDGELFFTMANGSHLRHVVLPDKVLADARLGDAPSWKDVVDHRQVFPLTKHERAPYLQIDFVGGFTGAAGGLVYSGNAWPEEFAGNHFVCEPTVNLVHRDVVAPAGSTYAARKPRQEEFLASRDLWFRPVHLRTGPDGAMYVLDFYNQAAVHNDTRGPRHGPTNAAVRPDRDHLHGRIWRVRHAEQGRHEPQPLGSASTDVLLDTLEHENRWQRMAAHRLLLERGPLSEKPVLARLGQLALGSRSAAARVHALWLLHAQGPLEGEALSRPLRDPDPGVRKNAARIHALTASKLGDTELVHALKDPDPRAWLETVLSFRDAPVGTFVSSHLQTAWVDLDDWRRSAAFGLMERDLVATLGLALHIPRRMGDARPVHPPEEFATLVEAAAGRIARSGDPERIARAAGVLGASDDAPTELLELALRAFHAGLPASFEPETPIVGHFAPLLRHRDTEIGVAALPLVTRWEADDSVAREVEAFSARLVTMTQDPDVDVELRLRCLSTLLSVPDLRDEGIAAAQRFLDPFFASDVQRRVIEALGSAAEDPAVEPEAARVLVRAFPAVSHEARAAIFQQLVQRPARLEPLLAAVADGAIAPNELGPHRRFRLEQHPDAAIAARARALLGSGERKEADALIAELLPVVTQPGDPANGRMLFRQNCANCHTVRVGGRAGGRVEGFAVGPDLTGIGAHGAEALLPFIVDPNRSVEAAYLEYVIDTVDGRMVTGVVVRETADRVVLRSSAREDQVMRDEIESMRSTGRTPMPERLEDLGAEALRDILAFLSSGFEDYRLLDLEGLCTSSTNALYDRARDAKPMRFRETGVIDVDGVPFEILDPGRLESNALTLMGGMAEGWESRSYAMRVEVPVGFALQRLHVLGGIAAWGFPFTQSRQPIVKLTWRYADGEEEERILTDGDEFADWIRRHDVAGSVFVDLLEEGSWGQVRRFTLDPGRHDVAVETIVLESFDDHLAPTFLALTAQVSGAEDQPPVPPPRRLALGTDILIVGGGTSHDYHAWFERVDGTTLSGLGRVTYTEIAKDVEPLLDGLQVLYLCNNQPLADPGLRRAIFDFVDDGGALLLVHAATWYNWPDWPEYNAELAGGGARSHEAYGEFEVRVDAAEHPLAAGLPATFRVRDELYRFEPDPAGSPIRVLATGRSPTSDAEYPVVWTVERGRGRIACITLGHDGAAHTHAAYRALLGNAVSWLLDS